MTASPELAQLATRIPRTLKEDLEKAAKDDGRTLSNLCAYALQTYIDRRCFEKEIVSKIDAEIMRRFPQLVNQAAISKPEDHPRGDSLTLF